MNLQERAAPARSVRWCGVGALALAGVALLACAPARRGPEPGTARRALDDQAMTRTFLLHAPSRAPAQKLPLVVALHGGASSGEEMEHVTGFSRIADREGFFVAYPDALGMPGIEAFRVWNPRACCSRASLLDIDDVSFVEHLVRALRDELSIDGRRIYLVGYSNGGALAYRVAADDSHTFAALGIYAALPIADGPDQTPVLRYAPLQSLSLVAIHSVDDARVPYRGSGHGDGRDPPFPLAGRAWARALGCVQWSGPERARGFTVERASGCRDDSGVELVSLDGWTHEWPSATSYAEGAPPAELRAFDAAERMWSFFAAHRKGGSAPDARPRTTP